MIDLGQAIPRPATPPAPFTWVNVAPDHHERGALCVIRQASGTPTILRIDPPHHWREWAGAFCRL